MLLALSAIILSQSYGFAYADHGGNHYANEIEDGTITIATNSSSYEEGEMINVSGSVSDYVESDPYKNFDVTLRLIASASGNSEIASLAFLPITGTFCISNFARFFFVSSTAFGS